MDIIEVDQQFTITNINPSPEGKAFSKITRVEMDSGELLIDINSDIYPVEEADKFSTRFVFGNKTEEVELPERCVEEYEYIMYGQIYKYKEMKNLNKVAIYVSFGGLLMRFYAEPGSEIIQLTSIDNKMYILMRKVPNIDY
eukprot:TRINITY_DN3703_c3_g1_i2.p1 TRINITY_DN3703_c3_g1~~TRINITY_DN3703_c3_g1_i2.p1  ORF type:complete len:141 (-),score=43.51 TRINITY_DN3703_c3_g1_i2:452-874(-)